MSDYLVRAALAQLVEHRIRNAGVACSSHAGGTIFLLIAGPDLGRRVRLRPARRHSIPIWMSAFPSGTDVVLNVGFDQDLTHLGYPTKQTAVRGWGWGLALVATYCPGALLALGAAARN